MAKFIFSKKALEDLSKIWEYTFDTWSESQADKYYYMLLDNCQELADGKIAGKSYSQIDTSVLGFKTGRHIIFYRKAKKGGIELARILHERMDLKNRIL